MHVIYKRIRNLNFPVGLQLHLFDHVILPIAVYGCEIWGFENSHIIENLHNGFLRHIVNLRKSIPIYMLHTEMGWHPTQINIKSRMIGFWLSIVNGKESKLSKLFYTIMLKEQEKGFYDFKWIRCHEYHRHPHLQFGHEFHRHLQLQFVKEFHRLCS